MQCSEETIASLFYNASSSFQLLLLFSYLTSIFLPKILHFFGGNIFFDTNAYVDDFTDDAFSGEEKIEDDGVCAYDDKLCCMETTTTRTGTGNNSTNFSEFYTGSFSIRDVVPMCPNMDVSKRVKDTVSLKIPCNIADDNYRSACHVIHHDHLRRDDDVAALCGEIDHHEVLKSVVNDEEVIVIDPSRGNDVIPKNKGGEIYGEEICTVGSTSKSSSDEWRSTIKDSSCTSEDPFSSSSRRSTCPKWESCTVFHKYEEEMLFFDRICAQKLLETESLRSKQSKNPRSISERIAYKFRPPKNPQLLDAYNELEAAYVAQTCMTWEALCWNYKHFRRRRDTDGGGGGGGCPAYIAQQFQQFLVLLQRFIENEPYEEEDGCGRRRPEVYARVRRVSPKLLQVPQYRDWDEEEKREGEEEGLLCSRIPSDSLIQIMEESIRTFMNFMKADKDSRHCPKIPSFFKKSTASCSPHPILRLRLNKENNKKKRKLKEMKRSGKWGMRKKKLKEEEEMEILMAQIDLKVVSRVLRMKELNGEQLHWCEDKLNKVKITHNGKKLHRDDSSTLFYPAH